MNKQWPLTGTRICLGIPRSFFVPRSEHVFDRKARGNGELRGDPSGSIVLPFKVKKKNFWLYRLSPGWKSVFR